MVARSTVKTISGAEGEAAGGGEGAEEVEVVSRRKGKSGGWEASLGASLEVVVEVPSRSM
jgi:hypothetical protein